MSNPALIAFISLIVLMSCFNTIYPTSYSYTVEQYDEETGLTLAPSENMWVSFSEMITVYTQAKECMEKEMELDITVPGPTVYFKSFKDWFNGAIGAVWGFELKGTIYINTDEDIPHGFRRSNYTDRETLRHEYIHSILFYITEVDDTRHLSNMYELCGLEPEVNN